MGHAPQLSRAAQRGRTRAVSRPRAGIALASAIFALTVLALLTGVLFTLTDAQHRASKGRVETAQALQLAEWGAAHAAHVVRDSLSRVSNDRLLRGSDNAAGTADDSLLVGYGLGAALQIPAAGLPVAGGRYTVFVMDDPADADGQPRNDSNGRILLRCTGYGANGARASVDVVLQGNPLPAVAIDGNLLISGNPTIRGGCGDVHANGAMMVTGVPVVGGTVSASGTLYGSTTVADTSGVQRPVQTSQPSVDVPDLDPTALCATAEYVAQADGFVLRRSDNTLHDARVYPKFGFRRTSAAGVIPLRWEVSSYGATAGTFCASSAVSGGVLLGTANVSISSSVGTESAPLAMSVIATGSIEMAGNPYLMPRSSDGLLLVAGGDMVIAGNSSTSPAYQGTLYARSQCRLAGTPDIRGQLICKNAANPTGSVDLVTTSEITGNATLSLTCGSGYGSRRTGIFWSQPIF
jgi:hypothetical protein